MNRQVHLVRYPDGTPAEDDFRMVASSRREPADGEALVAVRYLSMDPFPRLRMRADSRVGPPLPLDEVVDGRGVGVVLASRAEELAPGDWVAGDLGWQEFATLPGAKLQKLDPALGPLPDHLNALGPSGMTAYFAMQVVGAPQPGETVVIAPAAGSVGSLAGQIAKLAGARVIGIAAGDAQCAALTQDLGFDAAVDHRDLGALPDGVNLFLDGVGGATHDAVMAKLAPRGRAVLLGFISGYSDGGPPRYGAAAPVLFKRARVEGFLLADWQDRFGEAQAAWARWLAEGAIRPRSTIWNGLERTPAAFAALFGEAGVGKQLVRVSEGERE